MAKNFLPTPGDMRPVTQNPKVPYDLGWCDETGEAQWDTRMISSSVQLDSACAAIARGTLIDTDMGPVAIEDLCPGDLIKTVNKSYEPLRWIGSRTFPDLGILKSGLTFFRVTAGTFGYMSPGRATILSNRTALYVNNPQCKPLVGKETALVPLEALADGVNITPIQPLGETTFFNLAFEGQEAFFANGLPIEGYHPSQNSTQLVNESTLREMSKLFPFLLESGGFGPQKTPRLTKREAQQLEMY